MMSVLKCPKCNERLRRVYIGIISTPVKEFEGCKKCKKIYHISERQIKLKQRYVKSEVKEI